MKDKKKVGLVKRIAAGVCALFVTVSCFGGSESYYADDMSLCEYSSPYFSNLLCEVSSVSLPSVSNYGSFILFYFPANDYYFCYFYNGDILLKCSQKTFDESCSNSDYLNGNMGASYSFKISDCIAGYESSDHGKTWKKRTSDLTIGYININGLVIGDSPKIVGCSGDVICSHGDILMTANMTNDGSLIPSESYNSSLGYLQDLLCKELYLEDAEYAYDPNYLKKIWTFSNTSTSGLDITDGSYSVRHYQQITVRDTDIKDPVVKEYDMVLMDEFPAESLRYEYLSKDYSSKLETQSGFESLNFWETSILGQFVFTRNYFQLVRTNSDGSVEYGGLVKIDLKGSPAANDLNAEHETTTITPEGAVDTDGYVGGNMDYVQGSGSDYGQAENNADKELADDGLISNGINSQVNELTSIVMGVPLLISSLFSFLPEWCLDIVGVAFTISMAILVFKLAN